MSATRGFIVFDGCILWLVHAGNAAANGSAERLCIVVSVRHGVADVYEQDYDE